MANDRLINNSQGESIITGLNTIATKLDALKPISAADNGKVVVNGELTPQTSTTKTVNGTYNTTTNNEVVVDVANSYSQSDNGKVVSNQQLVSQTVYPTTVTENDTYDTTNYNSITVNVSGGSSSDFFVCTFDFTEYQFLLEDESGIIADSAFENCYSLTSITIPNSITSIGESAFYGCSSLATVTFEANSSLRSIGDRAFDNCTSLASITIPSGVTSIGAYVFDSCFVIETITFEPTTPPTLDGDLGIATTCTIRVPQGTLSDYTSASNYPDPNDYTYVEY